MTTENTIKAAVIGHPIAHSLSPHIHGYWLKKYGINGEYDAIDVHPDHLVDFLLSLGKQGYNGINITLPHKERAMEILGKCVDPFARFIGAVNTVIVNPDGIVATNTDFIGFARNLQQGAPQNFDFEAGAGYVVGAGGAARAVIFALLTMRVPKLILTNRTRQKAEDIRGSAISYFDLAPDKIEVIDWDDRHDALNEDVNLLVNTTSLGMEGQNDLKLNIIDSDLPKSALVTDIVYRPLITNLLRDAQSRGNPIVDGLGMLLHQAAPGFEAWFGVKPEVDDALRKMVLQT